MKNHRAFLEQTIIPNIANNTERLARYWWWQQYTKPWVDNDGYAFQFEKGKFRYYDQNAQLIHEISGNNNVPWVLDAKDQWIVFQAVNFDDDSDIRVYYLSKAGKTKQSIELSLNFRFVNEPILNDQYIILYNSEQGNAYIYDRHDGRLMMQKSVFPYKTTEPLMQLSPDGRYLIYATVFDGEYDYRLMDLSDPKFTVYSLFSLKEHARIIMDDHRLGFVQRYVTENDIEVAWFSWDLTLYEQWDDSAHQALQAKYQNLSLTDNASINVAIDDLGLAKHRELLQELIRPVLRLGSVETEDELPIGASRFGGSPDLLSLDAWPKDKSGQYMQFMGQLNLAEIAPHFKEDNPLPRSGLLSIFSFDQEFMLEGVQLIYQSDISMLQPVDDPLEGKREFEYDMIEKVTTDHVQRLLPYEGGSQLYGKKFTREEVAGYQILLKSVNGSYFEDLDDGNMSDEPYTFLHSLLGYPFPVQNNDMEMEVAMMAEGHARYSYPSTEEERIEWMIKGQDWVQLLEINETSNFIFGDAGVLYIFIHKDDLAKQCFDRVFTVSQCH